MKDSHHRLISRILRICRLLSPGFTCKQAESLYRREFHGDLLGLRNAVDYLNSGMVPGITCDDDGKFYMNEVYDHTGTSIRPQLVFFLTENGGATEDLISIDWYRPQKSLLQLYGLNLHYLLLSFPEVLFQPKGEVYYVDPNYAERDIRTRYTKDSAGNEPNVRGGLAGGEGEPSTSANENRPDDRSRKRRRRTDSEDEEEEEAKPPAAEEEKNRDGEKEDDDDDNKCNICYEEYTSSGDHRLVSLKCGHFFGRNCIERWIHGGGLAAECPNCKGKAKMADVRLHFVKSFKVADNSELVQLRESCTEYKAEVVQLKTEVHQLKRELTHAKNVIQVQAAKLKRAPMPTIVRSGRMRLAQGPNGEMSYRGSTVGARAFDYNGEYFAVGILSPNSGSLARPHAIRKVWFDQSSRLQNGSSLRLHGSRIRVVVFSPFEGNLVLSGGEDHRVVVHCMLGDAEQREWQMPGERQVWSGCWMSPSRFAVGLQNGRVYEFDRNSEDSESVRDVTKGIGHFPIIFLAYDAESEVLVVASFKKVIAYRGDKAFPLISNEKDGFESIRSVAWDPMTLAFVLTFSATGGKNISHTLYRLDIDDSKVACGEVDSWATAYFKCSTMWNNCLFSLEPHGLFSVIFCEDNRTLEAHDWSKKRQNVLLKFSPTENVSAMKALSGDTPNGKTIAVLTERSLYFVKFRVEQ